MPTLRTGSEIDNNPSRMGGAIGYGSGSGNLVPRGGGSGSPSQLVEGQAFEAGRLSAIGAAKNTNIWRPTIEDAESAAFRVIVGGPKYTQGGALRGTILDSTQNGLLEIKGGTSSLDSSYQMRLQVYRSVIEKNMLTIDSTRPINPTFQNYLLRWGVNIR